MDLRPSSRPRPRPASRAASLLTADGVRLSAAYDAPAASAQPRLALVVAHGFTGGWRRPDNRRLAEVLCGHGAVVSYDSRGHGRSAGVTTLGDSEVLDLDEAVRWARWLGFEQIVTVGFSMGGSVVLRQSALAGRGSREAADAVVSVSAAGFWFYKGTGPMRLLHQAVASPVGRGVLRHGFGTRVTAQEWEEPYPLDPSESAALVAPTPLLVVHGDVDTYFPVEHLRSISDAARAGAAERGVADRTTDWLEPGFAHAESAVTPELLDRIGRWARDAAAGTSGTTGTTSTAGTVATSSAPAAGEGSGS